MKHEAGLSSLGLCTVLGGAGSGCHGSSENTHMLGNSLSQGEVLAGM